ncbi:MAG TPA: hypothetical protein VIS76_11915 [Pseudomonadales bacterium]
MATDVPVCTIPARFTLVPDFRRWGPFNRIVCRFRRSGDNPEEGIRDSMSVALTG